MWTQGRGTWRGAWSAWIAIARVAPRTCKLAGTRHPLSSYVLPLPKRAARPAASAHGSNSIVWPLSLFVDEDGGEADAALQIFMCTRSVQL